MDKNKVDMFRRLMPKEFAKTTKLCPQCGNRIHWDETKRALVCTRCKTEY